MPAAATSAIRHRLGQAQNVLIRRRGAKKVKLQRMMVALSGAALILATVPTAEAQVRIGVISSATGPIAFVGIEHRNSLALLPKKMGDASVTYVYYDDGSDPTQTVRLAKKLLVEDKVDALIGPSGSPNAMALVPLMAEAKTPMLATVGTQAVVLPMDDQKRWVFKTTQNDALMAEGVVEHMAKTGIKTVGFIGYNDPYGESWYKTIVPMLQKAGIQVVANERYARQDSSVTGQVLKIVAAKPDAVFVVGVGAGAALPNIGLANAGYKGRIYQTHGAAHQDRRQSRRGHHPACERDAGAERSSGYRAVEEGSVALCRGLRLDVRLQARHVRRRLLRRRPPPADGRSYGPDARETRNARIPDGAARRAGRDQRTGRHAGRLQHDRAGSLRVRPARSRAGYRQGRPLRADRGLR